MLNNQEFVANTAQIQAIWDDLQSFTTWLDEVQSIPLENANTFRQQLRERQVEFSYLACKLLFEPFKNVKVSLGVDQPFRSMAYVSVEGPKLQFIDNQWFVMAASFANNIEFYPKTSKNICMNLTFYSR